MDNELQKTPEEPGQSITPEEPDQPKTPEEPGEPMGPAGENGQKKTKLQSYKTVCAKLGIVMSVYFICRIFNGLAAGLIREHAVNAIGHMAAYALDMLGTVTLVYIIPMLLTAVVFKSFSFYRESGGLKPMYKKPRRLARALGTFPAMYGLGVGTLFLTYLAAYLISRLTGGQTFLQDILQPTAVQPASDLFSALMMVFLLVVIAPVFEEIWVRGIMYDALKPYGCGMAIIISSVLFGLMHGTLHTLFYTTALGFALGYVRYATGSLFVTTVLHALINSVVAGLLFLMTMTELASYSNALLNTVYYIYIIAFLVLIIVGVIAFIMRIPVIKKYKIENEWTMVGARKKTALFFASIPVIIMLVLAINEHANGWFLDLIIK